MRVLFINKFAPPDPAPTALLITDVADVVRDMGGDVSYASSHAGYRGKRRDGWRRWLREAWGNIVLLWLGLTRPRPDIVICLTDPPACLIIATVIARLRRAKLLHWAMDIYPELAVALGELRAGSIVHRALRSGMRWGYKSSAAIACLDQDMIEKLGLAEDARAFISTPWPPLKLVVPEAPPVSSDANVRWLYSGNLGRAHDYETILRAQHRLERDHLPFELVFQGGGACRNS